MVRIFLKDAYFSISLHQKLKYVRFQWKGNLFQFSCLCFGLGLAPRIFTKILKIPISMLLRINIELIIYLDDILIMGRSLEEILMSQDKVIFLLQHLGFVRNWTKHKTRSFGGRNQFRWHDNVPPEGKKMDRTDLWSKSYYKTVTDLRVAYEACTTLLFQIKRTYTYLLNQKIGISTLGRPILIHYDVMVIEVRTSLVH